MQDAKCKMHFELPDHFVLTHRGAKNLVDPHRAYASVWEEELAASGELVPTAVVFLTNRECPFRCVMCDLWINTLDEVVPRGAVAHQIRTALADLPSVRQIKLYNAGSFFDARAVPEADYDGVAAALAGVPRVIVESHPTLVLRAGARLDRPRPRRERLDGGRSGGGAPARDARRERDHHERAREDPGGAHAVSGF